MKPHALFMAPMTTWSSNADLTVSDAELRYYEARARNVDYVITGCTFLQRNHQGFSGQFFAGSDDYIQSLTQLSGAIHRGGAKAILQVHSPGRMVSPDMQQNPYIEVVSASAVRPDREGYKTPRALSIQEIATIVRSYYEATIRAIRSGFDGLEVHGANTYLPQQFVSPLTNLRDDAYGRDRLLFVRELMQAILRARLDAGHPGFIVGYRFSPEEREPGGLRLSHTLDLLDYLCSTDIDYLHVSLERYDRTSYFGDQIVATALFNHIAHRKPLVGVGKIRTRSDVKQARDLGYDHIAIGTGLLLNPSWATQMEVHTEISEDAIPPDIPLPMRHMLINVFAKM